MKKRMVAIFLLLVLVLSMVCTAALAAKPTATLRSAPSSVKRGKTITFKYYLKSGSYTKKSGQYRARFATGILKGSINGAEMTSHVGQFTGNINLNWKVKVPKNATKGKYVNVYGTLYRSSIYSSSWYVNTAKTKNFKVK